ncbi:divalent-cation tolerance protein CutA [Oleiharenicola lentus]|uniref:divalent-cation tolerance protein CutA n=1 Tax=Oleiharenicola lentus TaxID=2508720 RepID=UPI003F680DAC
MFIAWTTTSERADADRLALGSVEAGLAACAQVDAGVTSYYRWAGKIENTQEFRIWFKYLPDNASRLSEWIHVHHPYATPQWIEVAVENVGEKYLSWARANSISPPFPSQKPS